MIEKRAIDLLRRAGGARLVERMAAIFAETGAARVNEMTAAAASGDERAVRATAHSLKSSAAQLGASELAESCSVLELEAAAGARKEMVRMSRDVERHFEEAVRALKEFITNEAAAE